MVKKKILKHVNKAKFFITATFNNTIITVTDMDGNTLCWGSAGVAGFKGARKSTPFAATITAKKVIETAKMMGVREIEIYIKGPGMGREATLRALKGSYFKVNLIADVTPIPHNGVRPKKRRRV
ncbi:30S ribosomal protein S11 [Candidatus Microgenomates bacterium]|nr:30S ribosomal protein S11 [Candidatus Microgenomates bacterium]